MICIRQKIKIKGMESIVLSVPYGFFEDCIKVLENDGGPKEQADVMQYWLWRLYKASLSQVEGWEELYYSIVGYMENIGEPQDDATHPSDKEPKALYDSLFDMSASVCSAYHMSPFALREMPLHEVITLFNRIIRKGRSSRTEPASKGYVSQEEKILPDGTREIRRRVYADNF